MQKKARGDKAQLVAQLRKLKKVIVATHISPDADAIASSGALLLGLKQLGADGVVYLPEAVPSRMKSLASEVPFVHEVPAEPVDAVIVIDNASQKRIGKMADQVCALGKILINIDHHESNSGWGDISYVDPSAAAAAQIVVELYSELGLTFSSRTANLLYAGINEDTGSFRFSNTDSRCLEIVTELVRAGANPELVANDLYYSVSEAKLRLIAEAIGSLEVVLDGRFAIVSLDAESFKRSGAREEDSEGVVDLARSISGTLGAAFFREIEDKWKISIRSKSEQLDVNKIAQQFGGGGHPAAAGCTFAGSLEQAKKSILDAVAQSISENN